MTIDATFWVAISFLIFTGILIYLKVPQKIDNSLSEIIKKIKGDLENAEKLEQLRFLDNGYKIKVINFNCHPPLGIDTPEDLKKANLLIKNEKI